MDLNFECLCVFVCVCTVFEKQCWFSGALRGLEGAVQEQVMCR